MSNYADTWEKGEGDTRSEIDKSLRNHYLPIGSSLLPLLFFSGLKADEFFANCRFSEIVNETGNNPLKVWLRSFRSTKCTV